MPRIHLALLPVALATASWPAFAFQTEPSTRPAVLHPADVALVEEGAQGYVYRHFPTGLRLYTFDKDRKGRSMCDGGCASQWPPVTAPDGAAPVGAWTIIQRSDGRRQWALLGRPIYVRYHDAPETASGDGEGGVWHLIRHTATKDADPFKSASAN
jgi:predicted lipoprotein with Yx(FWY)xxD motif